MPDTNGLLGVRELGLLRPRHAAEILEVVWSDELLAEFEHELPDRS